MPVPGLEGRGVLEVGESAVCKFLAHRMTTQAAALAYRALFGFFPLALLVVVLLGFLDLDDFFQAALEKTGPEQPRGIAKDFAPMIEAAREQATSGLLSFGVAVSLYSVYALARTLVEALNAVYEVTETRPRWKRLGLLIAFGPALVVATIAATGSMLVGSRLAEWIAGLVGLDEVVVYLWGWLRIPVALLLLAVVVSIVYRFAPAVQQPYRLVTPGAAIAVIAWVTTSLGFSLYLATFADYGATYGSLGAAVGLLFYLYLSASVLLFGAEVNAAIRSP